MPLRVFLTGASSGLGEALARHYARRGATLGLVARRGEELDRVARSIAPATVSTYTVDVRDAGAMVAAARDFDAKHGVPDIVIANAGVSRGTLVEHAEDLEAFRAVFDTNVAGIVHTFHPFVAPMRAAGRGTLVGIASVAGFRGIPGSAAYSASKAAAIKLLESLRVELRASGVRVVSVCPGYVATPMTDRSVERIVARTGRSAAEARRLLLESNPQGRLIEPEEVAFLAVALCDERARGVNGQAIGIDGGAFLG